MSTEVHSTTITHINASVGNNVIIGPYCLIGPHVTLEAGVELKSHVVIEGRTTIGAGTVIYPFASIGHSPQDLKYKGENSEVRIGRNNIIREHVTVHPGTEGGGMITSIGDECLLMVGVHIAHDCRIGDRVILANYVSLAGHVEIDDHVRIGGLSAVHQYVRIGKHSMIGGVSGVARDVIPFGQAAGERAMLEGVNLVGMKRQGFDTQESLEAMKVVEEIFADEGILANKIEEAIIKYPNNSIIKEIIEFLKKDSTRAFCTPRKK